MNKKGILPLIGTWVILALLCCNKNSHSSRTPNNSLSADDAHRHISFKKTLEIHEDWFDYGSLFMDSEGNLVYWQERDRIVSKFDPEGNKLFSKIKQAGQGYGDLNFFDFEDGGDRYLVYDKVNMRINHFDKEFNIQKSEQMHKDDLLSKYIFRLDERKNRYFVFDEMKADPSGWNQDVGVARYDADGKKKMTFFQARFRLYDFKDGVTIGNFWGQPFLRYIVDHDGALWICDRREYKIDKYDSSGRIERTIEKEYEKIPLRGETEKKFRSYYRLDRLENQKNRHVTPAYINPIMDFILLEKYILVLTMENQWKSEKKGLIAADVFDREGHYIHKTEIPEFYACYSLTNQFKSAICYEKERLAALESDEDMENFKISLYQLQYANTNE